MRLLEAEQLVRRAQAERVPNVEITATPFYAVPERDTRVEVNIRTKLPLYNRNQGNILAAQADVARLAAEVRQVELRLTERLAGAFQRYAAARAQVEAYQKPKGILANAAEALRLVEFGYEKGDAKYNYTAVLQAQQVLFQAELAHVQALGEQWRALAELSGLVQDDELLPLPSPAAR